MNPHKRFILPRMSYTEHDLYLSLFGVDAIPGWLLPAEPKWVRPDKLDFRAGDARSKLLAAKVLKSLAMRQRGAAA